MFLDKSKHLGEVDRETVEHEKELDPEEEERQGRIKHMPILDQCYNLMDFEVVARRVTKKTAWAYYSSGADDEIVSQWSIVLYEVLTVNETMRENLCFRPRILHDVENIDLSIKMLGTKVDIPFYVTATALGQWRHCFTSFKDFAMLRSL